MEITSSRLYFLSFRTALWNDERLDDFEAFFFLMRARSLTTRGEISTVIGGPGTQVGNRSPIKSFARKKIRAREQLEGGPSYATEARSLNALDDVALCHQSFRQKLIQRRREISGRCPDGLRPINRDCRRRLDLPFGCLACDGMRPNQNPLISNSSRMMIRPGSRLDYAYNTRRF